MLLWSRRKPPYYRGAAGVVLHAATPAWLGRISHLCECRWWRPRAPAAPPAPLQVACAQCEVLGPHCDQPVDKYTTEMKPVVVAALSGVFEVGWGGLGVIVGRMEAGLPGVPGLAWPRVGGWSGSGVPGSNKQPVSPRHGRVSLRSQHGSPVDLRLALPRAGQLYSLHATPRHAARILQTTGFLPSGQPGLMGPGPACRLIPSVCRLTPPVHRPGPDTLDCGNEAAAVTMPLATPRPGHPGRLFNGAYFVFTTRPCYGPAFSSWQYTHCEQGTAEEGRGVAGLLELSV